MSRTARPLEGGVADTRARIWSLRLRAPIQLLLAAGLVVLFVFVARRVYVFSNPTSRAAMVAQRPFYLDLVTRVPNHAHLALLVLGIALSLAGPGSWLLSPLRISWHDEVERLLFGLMAGMAALTFTTLVLGWAQQIHPAPLLAVVGVCALITAIDLALRARTWRRDAAGLLSDLRRFPWRLPGIFALAAGVLTLAYLALLGALSPEVEFDAVWYHLGVPAHYAAHGGLYDIVRLTRYTPAGDQPYQDLLYTFLIPLVGVIGAKILHWVDALLAVAAIIYLCRAWFASLAAGLLGGLVFISLPVVAWSASTGSNDLPQAFLTLLCFHGFLRWRQTGNARWLMVAALSVGYALGFKITGAIILVPFLAAVGLASLSVDGRGRRPLEVLGRGIGLVAGTGAVALAICVPWLFRSYQLTGDPVFPEFASIFKTPYWTPALTRAVSAETISWGGKVTLLAFLRLPWDTAAHPYLFRTVIGPVFLVLAPLVVWAAVALRGNGTRRFLLLGCFALAAITLWYLSGEHEIRYAYGAVAILCALVGVSVLAPVRDWSGWVLRGSAMAVLVTMVVLNSQLLVAYQPASVTGVNWIAGRAAIDYPYLYQHSPPPQPGGPMMQYLNTHLSTHDKVYVTTTLGELYLYSKPDLYNGWFYDSPPAMGQWTLESADAYRRLRAVGVDYVLISTQQVPAVMRAPLGPRLQMVYKDGQGQVLYRVELPGTGP